MDVPNYVDAPVNAMGWIASKSSETRRRFNTIMELIWKRSCQECIDDLFLDFDGAYMFHCPQRPGDWVLHEGVSWRDARIEFAQGDGDLSSGYNES